ncbi:MAG: MBL fold metallo-hydrolase [Thermoleophilia bacterium]|nr:MBL fold metallo-hydrolase [Thermoleophilia bacterium]
MLLERIEAPGIAHISYLIGDGGTAVVVDPRRDVEVYVERATAAGSRITDIVETHRNEDYVIGSVELAERTGAAIWHADAQLPYRYGAPAQPGATWAVGRFTLEALATPGHTPGGLSYLLREADGAPWIVFTGDTLFAGDVGRTDLVEAARSREMAALLHESLFGTLLPLGDEVIVAPGHGAGSVCGAAIASRPWTTIGLERRLDPLLGLTDRDAFVEGAAGVRDRPPYFRRIEVLNVEGAPLLGALPAPPPLGPHEFAAAAGHAVVVDTRWETAFAAGHVPGALSLWLEGLPLYAGWLLPYDRPLLLVVDGDDPSEAVRRLVRLGYDHVEGFLAGGMSAWHVAGLESTAVTTLTAAEHVRRAARGEGGVVLDVRTVAEVADAPVEGTLHIPLGDLPTRLEEVPSDRRIVPLCPGGLRSMTAASVLRSGGVDDVAVILGGLSAWREVEGERSPAAAGGEEVGP